MDTHNNFQMPSKQYLTETSEHQLESWHTAQVALLPAVSQAEPRLQEVQVLHVWRDAGGWSTSGTKSSKIPAPWALLQKQVLQSLTSVNTHNLSTALEHSCASTHRETDSHSEHESDVLLWNTFLNYWHNQFIISEIHARSWRCWDTVCRSCQHEKIILFSSCRHLNDSACLAWKAVFFYLMAIANSN